MKSLPPIIFLLLFTLSNSADKKMQHHQTQKQKQKHQSIEQIQQQNVEILSHNLNLGWQEFCSSPVDEGVMLLYNDINPSDATIHLMTLNNQSVELPIKSVSEINDFDINPKRKTLVYVNGYFSADSYFTIRSHLKMLQEKRRDINIILVDFAKNVQQLYFAIRHHIRIQGYFLTKILNVLVNNGIGPQNITLAGHSVGANIAALGAKLFANESNVDATSMKIGQLVAIDPAQMCQKSDVFVQPDVCSKVIVIHGEGQMYGIRAPLGNIDIYPNGIGFSMRRKLQPGCETLPCTHMYPFLLFMEALIENVMIKAIKCDNWAQFRKKNYDVRNSTVIIGLKYPEEAHGLYFCITQSNPPFTMMEHGLLYKKLRALKIK